MGIQKLNNLVERLISKFTNTSNGGRMSLSQIQKLHIGEEVTVINLSGSSDFRKELYCKAYVISKDSIGLELYLCAPLNDRFKFLYCSYESTWALKL